MNKLSTPLELRVPSLRRGPADLLRTVLMLTDDPRRESDLALSEESLN